MKNVFLAILPFVYTFGIILSLNSCGKPETNESAQETVTLKKPVQGCPRNAKCHIANNEIVEVESSRTCFYTLEYKLIRCE